MTNQEFSNEFDVLYNNITSNQAPGLNEYEKSVFLTNAQSQLVNEYFNAKVDGFGGGFDGSQKRQYDFSTLTKTTSLYDLNYFGNTDTSEFKLDNRSRVFIFPNDFYLSVNEIISDKDRQYSVIPLTHIEYSRLQSKPYSFPLKRQIWRLFTDKCTCRKFNSESFRIIIPKTEITNLVIKFASDFEVFIGDFEIPEDPRLSYNGDVPTLGIVGIVNNAILLNNSVSVFSIRENTLEINVHTESNFSNSDIIKLLQQQFQALQLSMNKSDWKPSHDKFECIKVAKLVYGFQYTSGSTDTASPTVTLSESIDIELPRAEIIGKFKDPISYQLRYVRAINPIILEDLDDYGEYLSIGGYSKKMNCELPEESHHEILERAVTLAKIAWQGATATQVANQQRESR